MSGPFDEDEDPDEAGDGPWAPQPDTKAAVWIILSGFVTVMVIISILL